GGRGGAGAGGSGGARRAGESGGGGGGAGVQAEPEGSRPERTEVSARPWLRQARHPWFDSGATDFAKAVDGAPRASPGSGWRPKDAPIATSAAAKRANLTAGAVRMRRSISP